MKLQTPDRPLFPLAVSCDICRLRHAGVAVSVGERCMTKCVIMIIAYISGFISCLSCLLVVLPSYKHIVITSKMHTELIVPFTYILIDFRYFNCVNC
jgi:type IV secretory pathway TrbL component